MSCVRESRNERNRYAVAVVKDGVGSKTVSGICSLFYVVAMLSNGIVLELVRSFESLFDKFS